MKIDPVDQVVVGQGTDRRGAGDGREAHPFGLFHDPARGQRRVRGHPRPRRQGRRPGGTGPVAARSHRRDLQGLRRRDAARRAGGGRLLHQQQPLRGRAAPARRVHILPDLRRRLPGRVQRQRRPPPRPRRRRAGHEPERHGRASGGARHPAIVLQRGARLERRVFRTADHGQHPRPGADHRRLQRPVRRQRPRRRTRAPAVCALRPGHRDVRHGRASRLLGEQDACGPRRRTRRSLRRRGRRRRRRRS